MAQLQSQTVVIPQSVSAGAALALKGYSETYTFWFDLNGATLTGQLQLANNEAGPWTNEGAAFSASTSINIDRKAKFVRVDVTAYTSGEGLGEIVGIV